MPRFTLRSAFLLCVPLAACGPPDTALFSENGANPAPSAAGSSAAVAGSSASGGAGAVPNGSAGGAADGPAMGGRGGGGPEPTQAAGAPGADPSAGGSDEGAGGADSAPDPVEPVCGNGKLEPGEACDDAGHEGEDGCHDCQVKCSDFGSGSKESEDHHCYNGYDEDDFEGAQADCVARGGHLVTIATEAENELAQTFVNESKFIGAFEDVGLMSDADAPYQWVTGEPLGYENWAGGEPDRDESRCGNGSPNNARCYEHCVAMMGDGSWADQRCDLADGYVCEWEPAGS